MTCQIHPPFIALASPPPHCCDFYLIFGSPSKRVRELKHLYVETNGFIHPVAVLFTNVDSFRWVPSLHGIQLKYSMQTSTLQIYWPSGLNVSSCFLILLYPMLTFLTSALLCSCVGKNIECFHGEDMLIGVYLENFGSSLHKLFGFENLIELPELLWCFCLTTMPNWIHQSFQVVNRN